MPTKEPMWIAHSLPGQIRFRFAPTKEDVPDLDAILQVPGVTQVRFNKITKSLLIIYDARALSEEELSSQLRTTLPNTCLVLKAPGSEERSADGSLLSQWLYDFAAEANDRTNRALGGTADLTSIIGVGFIVWGFKELIGNPTAPRWYDIWRAAQSILSR